MHETFAAARRRALPVAMAAVLALAAVPVGTQSSHEAPAGAPATGRLAPESEPGEPLQVSGVVVGANGSPVAGASLYVYQTDHEGYYGAKPESDNRNPRLKLYLRSDDKGAWAFTTVRPGSYPGSRVPAHIHFEVAAAGHASRTFEIVFEGDAFVTPEMRRNPRFSVRPVEGGKVTERIVLQ